MAVGAYQEFVNEFTGSCDCFKKGSYDGGDDLTLDDLAAYRGSAESKAKEAIIAAVVKAGDQLGLFKDLPSEAVTNADKLTFIINKMSKHGEFRRDPKVHTAIASGLAKAINSAVGRDVLEVELANTELGAEALCGNIAQYLGSLLTGMQSELLAVTGQISASIKHLYQTKGLLEESFKLMNQRIMESEDPNLKYKMAEFAEVHEALMSFIEQQLEILQNLINVDLKPTEKDIAHMIDDKLALETYLKSLDKKLGTQDMSKALNKLIQMLGVTGIAANVIDAALKRVGMSREEFANLPGLERFDQLIDEKFLAEKLPVEQADEYLKAYKLLRNNFSLRQNISKVGSAEMSKTSAKKRIHVMEETQKILFQSFFRNMDTLMKQLAGAVDLMSMKVGDEVPVSDKLTDLAAALSKLGRDSSFKQRSSWRFLLGYYLDAGAKARKEDVLGKLRLVKKEIDEITAQDLYRNNQYLVGIGNVIRAIEGLIDKYSGEINARFGQFEGGSADNSKEIDAMITAPKFQSTVNVEDSLQKLSYRIRVAQIHRNLTVAGSQLDEFGTGYENLVSSSIANHLKTKMDEYEYLKKVLSVQKFEPQNSGTDAEKAKQKAEADKENESVSKFLDQQWETRKKFWATVEAIDAYMKVFTDAIVKNPNDVQDIKNMLDDIEVIYDWYTNGAGNSLANVFDHFPPEAAKFNNDGGAEDTLDEKVKAYNVVAPGGAAVNADTAAKIKNGKIINVSTPLEANKLSNDQHYYDNFKDAASVPGNPYYLTLPSKGLAARNQTKDMFKSMSALKNLLSVFVHVGSKFGGEELRKKVFMTPTQIYNNLVEFIATSAFVHGSKLERMNVLSTKADDDIFGADQKTNMEEQGLGKSADVVDNAPHAAKRMLTWGVAMRSVNEDYQKSQGIANDFGEENAHFVHVLKAIAAKILTVTGTYDVFDRPFEVNSITPIRMILGGNSEMPKVEEGAVALYIRLPLLCHFYKNLFGYTDSKKYKNYGNYIANDKESKITFIPDVDGTYAGLIRVMFRKIQSDDISTYNDEDVKDIIRECNLIYQKMLSKNAQDPVMTAIYGLVDEVNRRYGILKKEDRDAYEKINNRFYSVYEEDKSTIESTDYALLPGEEDNEVSQLSGAEKLLGQKFTLGNLADTKKKHGISNDKHYTDLLRKFRCSIDTLFDNADPSNKEIKFKPAIKAAQHKIRAAASDNEKFKVAADLVRGINIKVQVRNAAVIMFHETVVSGLNLLSALHTLLANFRLRGLILNEEWMQKNFKSGENADKMADKIVASKLIDAADKQAASDLIAKLYDLTGAALQLKPMEVMEELIEDLQTFANDLQGLVTIKFDAGQMFINYGGLKTMVEELVAQVNSYMQGLQTLVPDELYEKYSGYKVGQFYWLQEELISKILVGRPNEFDNDADRDYDNLDVVFKGLSGTYRKLTGNANNKFGDLFAELIYYNANLTDSGIKESTISTISNDAPVPIDWRDTFDSLHLEGPPGKQTLDTRYAARYAQLYTWKNEFTKNRSLMFGFNQLVAKYIQCLYDPATQKIYSGALSGFANSMFSRALADPHYTYSDVQAHVWQRDYDARVVPTGPSAKEKTDFINKLVTAADKNLGDNFVAFIRASLNTPAGSLNTPNTTRKSNVGGYNVAIQMYLHAVAVLVDNLITARTATDDSKFVYKVVLGKVIMPAVAGPPPVPAREATNAEYLNAANIKVNNAIGALGAGTPPIEAIKNIINNLKIEDQRKLIQTVFGPNSIGGNVVAIVLHPQIDAYALAGGIADFETAVNNLKELLNNNSSAGDWIVEAIEETGVGDDNQLAYYLMAFKGKSARERKTILNDANAAVTPGKKYQPPYDARREIHPNYDDLFLTGAAGSGSPASLDLAAPTDFGKVKGLPVGYENATGSFGKRADPDADHVLFSSLAHILRVLTSTRSYQNQAPVYLFDNVADLPLYLKEKMRANLPLMRNLFKSLSTRAEFIREFYVRKQVNLARPDTSVAAAVVKKVWPTELLDPLEDSTGNKNRFSGIIDTIVRGCQIMVASCDQQLKEIGDDPKYLETYQNSIRDYRNQYGNNPLMPLSTTLNILRGDNVVINNEGDGNKYLPTYALGEVPFKWHYGVRSLVHQPTTIPVLEHVIGLADIVDNFNISVDGKYTFDKQKVDTFLKTYTKALRWVYEQRGVRGLLTPNDSPLNRVNMQMDLSADISAPRLQSINNSPVAPMSMPAEAYSIHNELATCIRLTENPTLEERIDELSNYIYPINDANLAGKLAVYNIVDLNIVPINVHALMRDIPLANLYNYSYTFDRLMLETYYGKSADSKIKALCDTTKLDAPESALDILTGLLYDPYAAIEGDDYSRYFRSMMLGEANAGEMGRPKFLSDQVYGKALFGSPYGFYETARESGPAAYTPEKFKQFTADKTKDLVTKVLDQLATGVAGAGGVVTKVVANIAYLAAEIMTKVPKTIDGYITKAAGAAAVGDQHKISGLMARVAEITVLTGVDAYNKRKLSPDEVTELVNYTRIVYGKIKAGDNYGMGADENAILSKLNEGVSWDLLLHINKILAKNIFIAKAAATVALDPAALSSTKLGKVDVLDVLDVADKNPRDLSAGPLTYLSDKQEIIEVVPADNTPADNGVLRSNTLLIRNLIFIVNLYRTVRLRLQRDLVYSKDIIRRSAPITAESLTEFAMNQTLSTKRR